jgi:hypothetical protein
MVLVVDNKTGCRCVQLLVTEEILLTDQTRDGEMAWAYRTTEIYKKCIIKGQPEDLDVDERVI